MMIEYRKIKVAILATSVTPTHPAGAQIMDIINHLKYEFDFTIYAREIDLKLTDKVRFIKIPIPLFKPLLLRYIVQYFLFWRIFKNLELHRNFDVVHAIEPVGPFATLVTMQYCGEAARNLLRSKAVKYHGWRRIYYPILLYWGSKMEKKLLKNSYLKKIIAPSNGLKEDLIIHYRVEHEIAIIPNGVNLDRFDNAKLYRVEMRKQLHINEQEFIGIIAGLGDWERKGLKYIIEAVALMLPKVAKILVVGGGNIEFYKDLCAKKGIRESFVFVGITNELEKYYGSADYFILPTANEAWSVVTLMAAASGLPILATRVNGVEEFIVDGVNGFFITRDPHNICRRIEKLTSKNTDLKSMGEASKRHVKKYDIKNVALSYAQIYRNLFKYI